MLQMGSHSNAIDWRLARETHQDLQIVGLKRTNLLLLGAPGATSIILDMLELGRCEPILAWRPGQPLELPTPGRAATVIFHDIDKLTPADQLDVLSWLDHSVGRIRVVSTTREPLWPRVQMGVFSEVLYYRLNTVCMNAAASDN
jgi:sigma-54-interacting transcriptional regulator